ncbi:SNF2 family N-terminal domain-containing protein [Bisporella sp. PMI_857]|nr:SNF2 family N-terminal domain-containing protein [Bisporella sp. PMI_857]
MSSQNQKEVEQPATRRRSSHRNKRRKLSPTDVDEAASASLSSTWSAYNPSRVPQYLEDKTGHDTELLQLCGATLSELEITSKASDLVEAGGHEDGPDEKICFGMLADLIVHPERQVRVVSGIVQVILRKPDELWRLDEGSQKNSRYGKLETTAIQIIQALEDAGCTLQLHCQSSPVSSVEESIYQKSRRAGDEAVTNLNIIIYGPALLSDPLGEWLLDNVLFLQDPINCEKDVMYKNPQLLREDDEEFITTFSLCSHLQNFDVEKMETRPDLFELLNTEHHLTETEAPPAVLTPLYSHQKQALTFMVSREQGMAYHKAGKDIWSKATNSNGQICYINNVTGSVEQDKPSNFYGGLLADQMGLGKSLSVISLIAAHPYSGLTDSNTTLFSSLEPSRATLLVVPLPLLESWDTQLRRHLAPNSLSWTTFHGPAKLVLEELVHFNVVITTYKIVSLQWRKYQQERSKSSTPATLNSLFSVFWHRVVLDEAHIIQNPATIIAKSACALQARHRWAVTGTPIQNRLTDLASLFKFLQVYPYSNPQVFEKDISQPWHRNDKIGCLRVKTLVNFVTLFRTRSVINLPDRHDEVYHLHFSPEESDAYEKVKFRAAGAVADAIAGKEQGTYRNALSWLNQLRLICNHGLMQARKPIAHSSKGAWTSVRAQSSIEEMLENGTAFCSLCDTSVAETMPEELDASSMELPDPILFNCLQLICGLCLNQGIRHDQCPTCSQERNCTGTEVTLAPAQPLVPSKLPKMSPAEIPTKVKALLTSLKGAKLGDKSVIFSYWTYTLDLIESVIKDAAIFYTRIDGKMSANKRPIAIQRFQEDPDIQVILVSITCGGAGLDLSAGSTVYLMEPQWNPMIEEQALCRVHRIGQKKAVKTIRYRIRGSFEEKVVTIQERKKDLVALTLSNGGITKADLDSTRLQYLRAALG